MAVNPAKGTLFQVHDGTSTYNTVGQRVSMDGPSKTVGKRRIDHLTSATMQYAPTLLDPGELSMRIWYDPEDTEHDRLEDLQETDPPTERPMRLIFADSGAMVLGGTGFVSHFSPTGIQNEGNLEADVRIQPTGLWTRS